jgi:hypothetical protein
MHCYPAVSRVSVTEFNLLLIKTEGNTTRHLAGGSIGTQRFPWTSKMKPGHDPGKVRIGFPTTLRKTKAQSIQVETSALSLAIRRGRDESRSIEADRAAMAATEIDTILEDSVSRTADVPSDTQPSRKAHLPRRPCEHARAGGAKFQLPRRHAANCSDVTTAERGRESEAFARASSNRGTSQRRRAQRNKRLAENAKACGRHRMVTVLCKRRESTGQSGHAPSKL